MTKDYISHTYTGEGICPRRKKAEWAGGTSNAMSFVMTAGRGQNPESKVRLTKVNEGLGMRKLIDYASIKADSVSNSFSCQVSCPKLS